CRPAATSSGACRRRTGVDPDRVRSRSGRPRFPSVGHEVRGGDTMKGQSRRAGWSMPVLAVLGVIVAILVAQGVAAQGAVLLADDFEDPAAGVMPTGASEPGYEYGYVDGEYSVRVLRANYGYNVYARGTFANTTLAADARIVGDPAGKTIVVGCRMASADAGRSGYQPVAEPATGLVSLVRRDEARTTQLVERRIPVAVRRDSESNRLELTCSGASLRAAVNGETVAEATDTRYQRGRLALGVFSSRADEAEARFDNLMVTDATPPAPPA